MAGALVARGGSGGWAGRVFISYLIGLAGSIALLLGSLALRGSVEAFVAQAIVGPLGAYSPRIDVVRLLMDLALVPGLLCVLICMALVLGRVQGRRRLRILLAMLVISLGLAVVVSAGAAAFRRDLVPVQMWVMLAPAASGLLVLRAIWPTPLQIPSKLPDVQLRIQLAIVGIGGVAAWAQYVPLGDPAHIWWAAPLPMVAMATLFYELAVPTWRPLLAGVACLSIASGAVLFFRELSVPRTELHGGAIEGMLVRDELLSGWLGMQAFLDRHELADADSVTADGLFAVWDGEYVPRDGAYVTWAWGVESLAPPGKEALYCDGQQGAVAPWAESQGARVVDSSGQVVLFPASWGSQSCAWVVRNPAE